MLSRTNLIGKAQPADAKSLGNRRRLEVDDQSKRHVSNTSTKLADPRRRCSECMTNEQLSTDRRPHLSTPYTNVLDDGMVHWKQQRGSSPNKDQMRDAELLVGVIRSARYSEHGNESLLWRSAKDLTLNRLQTVQGQRTKDMNFIENLEACFSSSLSLVTQHVDEAHDQHEIIPLTGRSASFPPTDQQGSRMTEGGGSETALVKIWKRKKEERRIGGLLLLNALAAIYGSSNVANKYVAEAAPALPASLNSLVKFTSALSFFIPSLVSALKSGETDLLRAGAELGALAFAASFVDSCNPGRSSSSSPSLMYAFTVVFVPLMELFTGRHSGLKLTRIATLAVAILGMGALEEEGLGWKGIICPQVSDMWGLAVSAISALHIFRSEALGEKYDPLRLNAVQCGVLAILSLGWELWSTSDASTVQSYVLDVDSLQSIPWVPLLYNGLVCSGLCSWLELRGLRSVHASTATLVYTTIPVWGAFLSCFASHDVPTDSAIIGGLVIAATSIYAQFISKNEDRKVEAPKATAPSTLASSTSTPLVRSTNDMAAASKENDYFPAGLLVSQLKFPYYAAQAKGLLVEIKFKLGALKSLGLVFTGMSGSSIFPTSPSSTPGSSSAPTSTPSTTTGANNLTTSHICAASSQATDVSHAATAHVPHATDLAAMSASHAFSNVFAHLSTNITTGLESALVHVCSDLMMAVEGAEGVATLLEHLVQGGSESAAHVIAVCLTFGGSSGVINTSLPGSEPTLKVMANFVETAPQLTGALDVQLDLLMNPTHLTDVLVDGFTHFSHLIFATY